MEILYGSPASVFVRKPRILLQEKSVEFISQSINPMIELSEEFKAISPLGKIPAFRDGCYTLSDSSAICAYIDAKYPTPSFYPKDPQNLGLALWFEEYADTALFQAVAPCYYQTVLVPLYRGREPDQNAIQVALTEKLPPIANYLDARLKGKRYLVSNQMTIADVTIVSVFFNMYLSGFPLSESEWPHLTMYLKEHFQRKSFSLCVADVMYEVEKAKLISNRTTEVLTS